MIRELQKGDRLTADYIRGLVREVRRNRVAAGPGLRLVTTPNGSSISLAFHRPAPRETPSWPYGEQFAFGLSIAGAAVTVFPGGLEAAGAYYVADQTSITITASGQYIALEFDRDAGSLSITGPHASRPTSDENTYRTPLYCFNLSGGTAVLARECINDLRLEAIV